ncbi:energy transducer TonB [Ruegeria sp. 2205SS24-7]|uniref:energy transducer TonB n=1 Tax=Ruegeria discodermiae TaxID=3064389 RepID=UPI0027419E7D|nr:energy transducer TonB [Ruegeria sp. 2205SS24-7]MDP5218707.1 energy transducer TonB [Ruegeria sp. 2205SS24-7]
MDTGTKISAVAHVALIGVALFGGAFRSEPLPFEVQEVSIISGEQFAAMTAPNEAPEITTQTEVPQTPEAEEELATLPEPETPEPEQTPPEVVPEPEPEPTPEAVIETPEPEVIEETPTLETPEPEVAVLPAPPGEAAPSRQADRVAPQPVAPPPPDATPDELDTPPVVAEEGADEPREEQEATAQEEATDRIVTEAEESAEIAPQRSPRPRARPQNLRQPVKVAEPAEPEPQEDPSREAAVNDALAEALSEGEETTPEPAAPAPTGPPLTSGEKESLRVAVSNCWNVGSLSTDALGTTVTVAVTMNQDGTPNNGSIRMLDSSGGSQAAARQAFEAARRAIIRCGARGFNLPAEKFSHWRDIEMTFNPERMRIK